MCTRHDVGTMVVQFHNQKRRKKKQKECILDARSYPTTPGARCIQTTYLGNVDRFHGQAPQTLTPIYGCIAGICYTSALVSRSVLIVYAEYEYGYEPIRKNHVPICQLDPMLVATTTKSRGVVTQSTLRCIACSCVDDRQSRGGTRTPPSLSPGPPPVNRRTSTSFTLARRKCNAGWHAK